MESFWSRVETLDGQVDVDVQVDLLLDARRSSSGRRAGCCAIAALPIDVDATVAELGAGVAEVTELLPELLGRGEGDPLRTGDRRARTRTGCPARSPRPRRISRPRMGAALDVVEVAAADEPLDRRRRRPSTSRSVSGCTSIASATGSAALPRNDRWQTGARSALRDELYDQHRLLAVDVLEASPDGAPPADRLALWAGVDPAALDRYVDVLEEIEAGGVFDLTTLSVAVRELRELRTRENPAAVRDPL